MTGRNIAVVSISKIKLNVNSKVISIVIITNGGGWVRLVLCHNQKPFDVGQSK